MPARESRDKPVKRRGRKAAARIAADKLPQLSTLSLSTLSLSTLSEDELVALAVDAGLDADAARDALRTGRYLDAVRADQAQAQAYGINGVPFFVIDGKYGVSGAQPAEAFAQIVRQVWAEHRDEAPVGA